MPLLMLYKTKGHACVDAFIDKHFDDVYNREKDCHESELKNYEKVYEETKSKYGAEWIEGFE